MKKIDIKSQNNIYITDDISSRIVVHQDSDAVIVLPIYNPGDYDLIVELTGKNSTVNIFGLGLIQNGKFNLRTSQHHLAPDTKSNLMVKTVVGRGGTFIYEGLIRVEKVAQHTDAYQRNDNLILSDDSIAKTSPVLEIEANEVRCTHAATIAPISENEIWYMASRGIDRKTASKMVIEGFLQSTLDFFRESKYYQEVYDKIYGKFDKIWQNFIL